MTRTTRYPLLATLVAALCIAPALAQGDDDAGPAPGPAVPPAPALLPTGPGTVPNPNATEDESFGRPRVAVVFDVETYSADGQIIATGAIVDILTTELQKTGRFNILSRKEDLKEIIQNAQIEQGSGLFDISSVGDLGRLKGLEYLIRGRISNASAKTSGTSILGFGTQKEQASIRIDFRLVKAETGELMFASHGEGSGSTSSTMLGEYGGMMQSGTSAGLFGNAIVSACKDIVTRIEATDLFPVRAVVKGTAGEKVVIDLGQAAGFYPGLKLDLREVNALRDDDTGEMLAFDVGRIYGTLVLDEVQIDRSIGRLETGSKKPGKGDLAEVPKSITLRRADDKAARDSQDERQRRDDPAPKGSKEEKRGGGSGGTRR